jgi:hypothetical protein
MSKPIKLPDIPEEERTPLVEGLVKLIEALADRVHALEEANGRLRDEVAVLKGEKRRPVFKPSKMEQQAGQKDGESPSEKKRPGSGKRTKTPCLEIHEERIIQPEEIPPGSRFKGYDDYTVQELVLHAHNIRYRLACWVTPEGEWRRGALPRESQGGHFGPQLVSYILYQHHHAQVTQPLLLEQLREWGIDISAGQIDKLLSKNEEEFSAEKAELLVAGLERASYVTVDDTGARHHGQNAYTTHIGNELFAWFESTEHKSRINFLALLQAGQIEYRVDAQALAYMQAQHLPQAPLGALAAHPVVCFESDLAWQAHLAYLGITDPRHVRIATEGALLAGVLQHPFIDGLAIISDDAGQFNILVHGLCWVHAERIIHKLLPLNDTHREEIATIRGQIWDLYAELKSYKQRPCLEQKQILSDRFDEIFTAKTSFATLNQTLKRLHRNKAELLLVLDRPEVPLHTNGSESDIRDYVKKRKISGGTRSDLGRRCRDTFASLKKTCRKHGISFWRYLVDRLTDVNAIPPLPHLIRQASAL